MRRNNQHLLRLLLTGLLIAGPAYLTLAPSAEAQRHAAPLRIFGYFQSQFYHQEWLGGGGDQNSFQLQQLNLMLQKDLARRWTAFVNFEVVNNFSSFRDWGSFNLEEAWIRWRFDNRLSLRLGLQIPTFNNLNTIKNRTPVIPYIIRPLPYERSFEEFIRIDEYIPQQAYVQAFGWLPIGSAKIDYAAYLGNSANINEDSDLGQTGIDTTDLLLFGGRIGMRWGDFKAGASITYDEYVLGNSVAIIEMEPEQPSTNKVPRLRLGGDLSFRLGPIFSENEIINVRYDESGPVSDLDILFYYLTLGVATDEGVQVYASYWRTDESLVTDIEDLDLTLDIYGLGIVVPVSGAFFYKAQYARVEQEFKPDVNGVTSQAINYFSMAISVSF